MYIYIGIYNKLLTIIPYKIQVYFIKCHCIYETTYQ